MIPGHVPWIADLPTSGHATTLDEAEAAFKRPLMRRCGSKAGRPKPQR